MKKFTLLFCGVFCCTFIFHANAQCNTWTNPTPATGWTNFNTAFGGAPTDTGTGCPFNEITGFEIFASEAYQMNNIIAGKAYTFSACNSPGGMGTGGQAWNITYTIRAPSGAIDAFGLDSESNCAITWTASESGIYLIVINEDGACGTSTNTATNNGYPAITCVYDCTTWANPTSSTGWVDFTNTFGGAPCDSGSGCPFNEITAFEIFASESYEMTNIVAGNTYTFSACNSSGGPNTGGLAWNILYSIITPSGSVDAYGIDNGSNCAITWTASENGTYFIVINEDGACGSSSNTATNNGYPAISCSNGSNCNPLVIEEVQVNTIKHYYDTNTNHLILESTRQPFSNIELFNLLGQSVLNKTLFQNSETINLTNLSDGIYLAKIKLNEIIQTIKFVKQ